MTYIEKELRKLFITHDLNVEKVSNEMGVNKSTLYQKLNGKREFTRKEIIKLSSVLELSDADILRIFFSEKVS